MKIFLLSMLSMFIIINLSGQFKVNIEAGSNQNLVSSSDLPDANDAYGYYFMLGTEYAFSKAFSLKLDVQQSVEQLDYRTFFVQKSNFSFLRSLLHAEFKPVGFVGFQVGGGVSYKYSGETTFNDVPLPIPGGGIEEYKYDVIGSAGFNVYFWRFSFALKYLQGVTDIDEVFIIDPTGTLFTRKGIRNSVLQLGLGYKFGS